MNRILKIITLFFAMMSPYAISAQALSAANSVPTNFTDLVASSFINYYTTGGLQEKLYMVTDKPYYSAGDTIYFSAFLVNSIYFGRTTDTKFIYVELIDAIGNVVSRLRVDILCVHIRGGRPTSIRICSILAKSKSETILTMPCIPMSSMSLTVQARWLLWLRLPITSSLLFPKMRWSTR